MGKKNPDLCERSHCRQRWTKTVYGYTHYFVARIGRLVFATYMLPITKKPKSNANGVLSMEAEHRLALCRESSQLRRTDGAWLGMEIARANEQTYPQLRVSQA